MKTKGDIVTYLHQACGSPVNSTWLKAIAAGFFTTWPGLTIDLVRKHLPKSIATAKGHLQQQMQGICSKKTTKATPQQYSANNLPDNEFQPSSEPRT
jgi:hypothetical protein